MSEFLQDFWQFNIEFSLLLSVILAARYAVRKTTRTYNAYLLWLSIPVGILMAGMMSMINFSEPPVAAASYVVQSYVVQPARSVDSWGLAGAVWAGVSALLLLRLLFQHLQLRSDLRRITTRPLTGLSSSYPVVGIDKDDFSPAVYGFVQPKIYFPEQLLEQLEPDQITLIIQHEEHHIHQQHLWLNLAWDIAVCCLWFNPLAYIARQSFRHDQELFCDYLVLHKSSQGDQRSYGHALLSTVSATHSVSLLCSWKTFNQLEERIMNIKRPGSRSSKLLLTLFGAAIVGATSLYAVSASEYDAAEETIEHEHEIENGHRRIRIIKDGVSYVEEDGQRYAVDKDENRRELTAEENEMFEQQLEKTKGYVAMAEKGINKSNAKIKIIRKFDDDHTFEFDEDVVFNGVDFAKLAQQLAHAEIQIERHRDQFEDIEHQLERAMREVESERKMNEQARRKALKNLEQARNKMARDREKMKRDMEKARQEIERARRELERARAELGKLEPPAPPAAPFYSS